MPKKQKPDMRDNKIKYFWLASLVLFFVFSAYKFLNSPIPEELPTPPLKQLASERGITLGNFAIRNHLDNKNYTYILTGQFELALADNTPNWYFTDGGLRPSRSEYNWDQMDEVVNFAQSSNMSIEAHHYLWGEQKWLPDWLKNGNYSKQELSQIMQEHIETVGKRYSGRIKQWTVVNEAFTRDQHLYDLRDWWADNTGGLGYIDQAFVWARQADPESKLILNDFNNESINDTSNAMYDYVKGALARGIPIDGIGMQMHIDGAHPPTKDEVISNMKRFAALGVGVYVTEFDVNMEDVRADSGDKDRIQENIYYEMMRACIESQVCSSFAFLGIYDGETWYNHIGLKDPRPLMFDDRFRIKPAYWGVRGALMQK
ncbi:MAG: endo-1,4-beta-xylanase [bacterium]|nr:endo-1,4-beta-xylanase [bacterium]